MRNCRAINLVETARLLSLYSAGIFFFVDYNAKDFADQPALLKNLIIALKSEGFDDLAQDFINGHKVFSTINEEEIKVISEIFKNSGVKFVFGTFMDGELK